MTKIYQLPDDVLLPQMTQLQAGLLSCGYEEGRLRYIGSGGNLLLQMMYPAVRDANWNTLPAIISDEEIQQSANGFLITYTALYGGEDLVYRANFRMEGRADNSIHLSMLGTALKHFESNRVGLCVLHPLQECCGHEATITTVEGDDYRAVFPENICPQPVFTNIRRMQWHQADLHVSLLLAGDTFETEDQRNWSDGSFKTYSSPSARPIPVHLSPGDSVAQQINLQVSRGHHKKIQQSETGNEKKLPFPRIGYNRPGGNNAVFTALLPLLQQVPLHHYRVWLPLQEHQWQDLLAATLSEAALLQTKLALVISLPARYEDVFDQLLSLLAPNAQLLHSLLLLQDQQPVTSSSLLKDCYGKIKKQLPELPVGYGAVGSFANLNRQRPVHTLFDFISFPLHPQVHATDPRSILDNLRSHAYMLASAQQIANGKAIHVSPITFTDPQAAADKRQYGALPAWFTLQSLQQLAGADIVTCFDLYGERGLLDIPGGVDNGEVRRSVLYDVLVAIKKFQPVFVIIEGETAEQQENSVLLENAAGERWRLLPPAALQLANRRGRSQTK